jgi:hypothetical protein
MRLNIFADDFINGLSAGGVGKQCDGRRYGKENTENSVELHVRS